MRGTYHPSADVVRYARASLVQAYLLLRHCRRSRRDAVRSLAVREGDSVLAPVGFLSYPHACLCSRVSNANSFLKLIIAYLRCEVNANVRSSPPATNVSA